MATIQISLFNKYTERSSVHPIATLVDLPHSLRASRTLENIDISTTKSNLLY